MGEINTLNDLCDLGQMLRLVRNLNSMLVNCKSEPEKLQIFVDISNGNGLYGNINELRQFICDHRVDIMLINEVTLSSDKIVNVQGYRCIRKNRNPEGSGVMIFF